MKKIITLLAAFAMITAIVQAQESVASTPIKMSEEEMGVKLKGEESKREFTSSMDLSMSNSSQLKGAKHASKGSLAKIYGNASSTKSSITSIEKQSLSS